MKNLRFILIAKHFVYRADRYVCMLLVCFCLVAGQAHLQAQQMPIQTQYFLNPYVYNPAFVGNEGYTEVFFTHRRQWVGVDGAPFSSTFSLHLPTQGRLAFGANISTARQGLLNVSGGMATVGYTVQLSHNQFFRGGISLGFRNVKIDQGEINASNPVDPAFGSNFNNHTGIDGKLGINYQIGGLTLGAAMENPFRRANELDADKPDINPLDQLVFSGAYRINLQGAVIEPQLLYSRPKDSQAQMEALATLFLRDLFWVGGSYRHGYGPSIFAGFRVAEVARVSYGYELASQQVDGFGMGSHELMLSYRFGDKKEGKTIKAKQDDPNKGLYKQKKKKHVDLTKAPKKVHKKEPFRAQNKSQSSRGAATKIQEEPTQDEPVKKTGTDNLSETGEATVPLQVSDRAASEDNFKAQPQTVKAADSNNPDEIQKDYYVVAGTFKQKDNAVRMVKSLISKGFEGSSSQYNSTTGYYYVYVVRSPSLEEARAKWMEMREIPGFEDIWINLLHVQ